ncbi:TfoX/Sxy family protein [Kaistia soli]|uniref:TfoX/Sxy family protein n=1 Tax=Kaistia soli TaxID=446684 RepID=UPI001FCE0DC8|nr:TfoX/Sxy family protein [Kaistia soli]
MFEPVGRVTFRRMFGGSGVFRDGLMFAIVINGTIHLKVDAGNQAGFEAEGCGPFTYARRDGKVMSISYWTIPERLLDEPDELRDWALAAIDVSTRAQMNKPAKPRRKNLTAADAT